MQERHSFWTSPSGFAAIGMIAVVTYFLLMEHREHLFQALPYLILLACPLMHVFMHGGHGHGHGGHEHPGNGGDDPDAYRRGFEAGRKHAQDREENDDAR